MSCEHTDRSIGCEKDHYNPIISKYKLLNTTGLMTVVKHIIRLNATDAHCPTETDQWLRIHRLTRPHMFTASGTVLSGTLCCSANGTDKTQSFWVISDSRGFQECYFCCRRPKYFFYLKVEKLLWKSYLRHFGFHWFHFMSLPIRIRDSVKGIF